MLPFVEDMLMEIRQADLQQRMRDGVGEVKEPLERIRDV